MHLSLCFQLEGRPGTAEAVDEWRENWQTAASPSPAGDPDEPMRQPTSDRPRRATHDEGGGIRGQWRRQARREVRQQSQGTRRGQTPEKAGLVGQRVTTIGRRGPGRQVSELPTPLHARPPPALGQFTADRVRIVHQKTLRASTSPLWARYHGREVAGQSCSQHKKSCIRHGLAR